MNQPPPIISNPKSSDDVQQLNLLSIFYAIYGGISLFSILFLVLHFVVLVTAFFIIPDDEPGEAAPVAMFLFMLPMYLISGALVLVVGLTNIYCSKYLRRKVRCTFCLVIAGFNCLYFPLGTALGVFTFVVLSRPSVRNLFEQQSIAGFPEDGKTNG